MNNQARRDVVAALTELAASPHYRDRADAGRGLAGFAEMTEAQDPLLELLLDSDDTFVTLVTAEALLRRQDPAGLTLVVSALAIIAPDHPNDIDWIYTAVLEVFKVYSDERDAAVRACQALTQDPDEHVRSAAVHLIARLVAINPILGPAQHGSTSPPDRHVG
ncbi:hypothetical protein [Nocardia sp. NPDC047038]|uniref:hypothetical protein n=1 Tax=Nocardia sp. NPDC047038 TaxID=3154338 RepID=UPI003405BEF2